MHEHVYGLHPDDFAFPNVNCQSSHKSGVQAYLAVDATPEQGGIVFFTNIAGSYYYQPDFKMLGIAVNPAKPTEFEMINLLIALCIFKAEILSHKTVRIIVDNNNLRRKGKMQRHALTETIAAILEWCDNFGCTINEIFQSNTPEDEPFLKIADKLSRNKEVKEWIKENASELPYPILQYGYKKIQPCNEHILTLLGNVFIAREKDEGEAESTACETESIACETESVHSTSRLRRIMQYFGE